MLKYLLFILILVFDCDFKLLFNEYGLIIWSIIKNTIIVHCSVVCCVIILYYPSVVVFIITIRKFKISTT